MKFNSVYIGTITGWVLVVLFEVIGSIIGGQQIRKAKMPVRIAYTILKYGRRTVLFAIAVTNLVLFSQKHLKN